MGPQKLIRAEAISTSHRVEPPLGPLHLAGKPVFYWGRGAEPTVVDRELFGELSPVDVTIASVGLRFVVGVATPLALKDGGRRVVELLVRSGVIRAVRDGGAALCLRRERREGDVAIFSFDGEYVIEQNGAETSKSLDFWVRLHPDGTVAVFANN